MARNEAIEWVVLNDFRPGIHSDYHFGSGATPVAAQDGSVIAAPVGAATIENTYRCVADMTGALVPLPKLIVGKVQGIIPTADNGSGKYPPNYHASFLLDAVMMGDLYVAGKNGPANNDRAGVFVMYGQWYQTDQMAWTVVAQFHRLFESVGAQSDIMFAKGDYGLGSDPTDAPQIGGGNFVPFRIRQTLENNQTVQSIAWIVYGSPGYEGNPPTFRVGAMSAGDQALTDYDLHNGATYPGYADYRIIGLFPDYADPDSLKSRFVGSGYEACVMATAHQGRFVAVSRTLSPMGGAGADDFFVTTERVHYGPPYDLEGVLGEGSITSAPYGEERSSRSGIIASVSADELLLVKHRGGGIMIRSSIEEPTVVNLPYVNSTHGVQSIPIGTPMGLIYGGRDGIYLWEGGETSRLLSRQIEGFLWNCDTTLDYLGSRGRFGWWEPWVCVPNNFLFDTRHESWWRLDRIHASDGIPVAVNCYDVSSETNRLYAFPYKLTSTTASPMWYNALPETLASSYSWQSQPICVERDRVISVQEVKLFATVTADSTVAITVTPMDQVGDDAAAVTTTFTLDGDTNPNRPQMVHKLIVPNFQAAYFQVQIVAAATNGTSPAPKIHSVSIGVLGDRALFPQSA